jgi:polyhydroxyalkanoate synthesis repressor PhaR
MAKTAQVVIKKYGNRRLYDTAASRYVNLEDIAARIREGADIKVVDARTGADLTRVTLTQIIVEDAKGEPGGLPVEVLRQLIVASDQVRQEFMKSAVATYQKLQTALQTGLGGVGSALSPVEMVSRFVRGVMPERDEVAELRRRVAELEASVGRRNPQGRRRKKAGPRPRRRK